MSGKEKKMEWNLYVLRYNYSGNYYVGTTINFESRMLDHWRKTSIEGELPIWSSKNKSTKGFEFYWLYVGEGGVGQDEAEHCENRLAKLLIEKIKDINNDKFIMEVHVGNGKFVDNKENNFDVEIRGEDRRIDLTDIDEELKNYLKNLRLLEIKKENKKFPIKCIKIGSVGEYHQNYCNEKWNEVEIIEYLDKNKERE